MLRETAPDFPFRSPKSLRMALADQGAAFRVEGLEVLAKLNKHTKVFAVHDPATFQGTVD
jgi:hypothetical protein